MSHLGQQLSALIDSELSAGERDQVLAHLARCEPCRAEAIALRALKQRMHALGEAAAGSDFMSRLLAITPPGYPPLPGYPPPGYPPRPGARRPAGRPAHRRARRRPGGRRAAVAAGASSLLVAGLAGAAAFLAGGGTPQPGPTVTPAVDVFMVQHAITSGSVPHPLAPGPTDQANDPGEP